MRRVKAATWAEGGAQASVEPVSNGAGKPPEPSTLIDFTAIKARRVKWLWPERIALAKITALSGRPKIGKGLLYSGRDRR